MTSKDGAPEAQPGGEPAAGRRRPTVGLLARAGQLEYDRILFFSDAIFAIAITLLVAGLVVGVRSGPDVNTGSELHDAIRGMEGFGISFAVIGLYWISHHTIFRYIVAVDRRLIFLNLLFLGTIAFLPYPTALLSSRTSQAASVIFYAVCCSATGLAEAACWLHATRRGADLAAPTAARVRRRYLLLIMRIPVVFLLSVPVALFSPVLAQYLWILSWVAGLIVNRLLPLADTREEIG